MRVAILSCGPSLPDEVKVSRYDDVIGINHAVEAYACSWWAFQDYETDRHEILPLINPVVPPFGVMTMSYVIDKLRKSYPERAAWLLDRRLLLWENLLVSWPPGIHYGFTVVRALVLAWFLGATEIDVYGHDMAGYTDYRFSEDPSRWNDLRWQKEQVQWDEAVKLIQNHGITVHRVGSP